MIIIMLSLLSRVFEVTNEEHTIHDIKVFFPRYHLHMTLAFGEYI